MGDVRKLKKESLRSFLNRPEVTMTFVLILFCIVLSFASEYFLTSKNIMNILRQMTVYAILGVGEAYIIITGGIDLSVGSLIAWTACVAGYLSQHNVPPGVILVCMLIAGLIPGLINGFLVSYVKLPPFIATLGMLNISYGGALLITNSFSISYRGTWIHKFGGGYIGIVPVSVIVMLAVIAVGFVIAKYTVFGRNIYAIGNSEKAATLSGIKVKRVKVAVYGITGVLAGVCGLLQIGLLNSADASFGKGAELDIIAAAVIGGISMTGGEGNIIGVLIGAAIMGVLRNAFVLLSISGYAQIVALGVVVIMAVAMDSIRERGREK